MRHEELSAAEHVFLIGGGPLEPPVPVVLEAYERFGRQIDVQLQRLVARWSHLASPSARSISEAPAHWPGGVGKPR
jgi:hypothetical protein